jgi:hypothetical protein
MIDSASTTSVPDHRAHAQGELALIRFRCDCHDPDSRRAPSRQTELTR